MLPRLDGLKFYRPFHNPFPRLGRHHVPGGRDVGRNARMIPKSGNRFSDKIMRKQLGRTLP
jgi:hypothetical protein